MLSSGWGMVPAASGVWWRALTGSEETLDNTHLMRMAGRFSRRIHGYTTRRARSARRSRHGVALGPAVCPEMERSLRSRLRPTNDGWRVDETYIRVKGKWGYLYRAVDSSGATIDFLLSAKRDAAAAERFLAKALGGENHPAPRVINTDEHAGYPPAIVRLKAEE